MENVLTNFQTTGNSPFKLFAWIKNIIVNSGPSINIIEQPPFYNFT